MDKKEIAKLKKDLLKNKSHDIYKNVQALFDLAYATSDMVVTDKHSNLFLLIALHQ